MPVGTPVTPMIPVGGTLSEAESDGNIPFRSAFPDRGVGNERACAHARKPLGCPKYYDNDQAQGNGPTRRKELAMLFLQLNPGEYLTIGDDIVGAGAENRRRVSNRH